MPDALLDMDVGEFLKESLDEQQDMPLKYKPIEGVPIIS